MTETKDYAVREDIFYLDGKRLHAFEAVQYLISNGFTSKEALEYINLLRKDEGYYIQYLK